MRRYIVIGYESCQEGPGGEPLDLFDYLQNELDAKHIKTTMREAPDPAPLAAALRAVMNGQLRGMPDMDAPRFVAARAALAAYDAGASSHEAAEPRFMVERFKEYSTEHPAGIVYPACCYGFATLAEFTEVNTDAPDLCAWAKAATVGESITTGGGAAAAVTTWRVS